MTAVISAGEYFFPRLLAEFMNRHPGVILNLAVHNREELLHQMADNLTDLAVMVQPPHGMDTVSEAFAPHHLALELHGLPAGARIDAAIAEHRAQVRAMFGEEPTR